MNQATILQIIPELGPGGAEQGCIDMAAAIIAAGGKAIVVSHGGARLHELDRIGALHINMPAHSKNPFVMRKNARRLRKIIKDHNVNIVHVRSRAPAWSAYWACKNTNAHYVATCHAPYNISGEMKRWYNSAITRAERIIAISETVAQYMRQNYRMNHDNIRVIHRGIAMDRFHPMAVTPERMIQLAQQWRLPEGAHIVMLPGRLTRWKGHHVLIEAMSLLNRKDIFCVLIGSDQGRTEYRKELENTITAKNMGAQVRIIDHCNDMPAAYMLATVAVSASTDPEGFGRVPVEAQAMGRPIVAADHGGAQETIKRGETGWLVEPSNPQAFAQAIEEALSLNANQRAILATHAMAHVADNFTKEIMAEQTLTVYNELLPLEIALKIPNDATKINIDNHAAS